MGRVAVITAVVVGVILAYCYLLLGIFGLAAIQGQTNEVPLSLRNIEVGARIFQATVTGLAFIVGGIFAYYRFFKEETYSDRLQPSVTTAVSYSNGRYLIIVTCTVQNAGQVTVRLDESKTYFIASVCGLGDTNWDDRNFGRIFSPQTMVQPEETISDQIWFEILDGDEAALRTDVVVAKVLKDNEKEGEDVVAGWMTRDIVNLLDIKGKINGTSDSDVESED